MLSLFTTKPLPAGSTAPLFTCLDEQGQEFVLQEQRGQSVVLVFYPMDYTPVCTSQLCALRDHYEEIRQRGALVFGINPGGEARHAGFRARHSFPFPLLVDAGKRVARIYRCAGILIKRTVYVIDEKGVIRYARRGNPPVEEILAALS
jgi:peroxiredoxin Q/BCP